MASADPERLAQVVANLMENALKYARSRVAVGVASSEQGAVIWVDDDGPGIAAEDLPRYSTASSCHRVIPPDRWGRASASRSWPNW